MAGGSARHSASMNCLFADLCESYHDMTGFIWVERSNNPESPKVQAAKPEALKQNAGGPLQKAPRPGHAGQTP